MPLEILENKVLVKPTIVFGMYSNRRYYIMPNTWDVCHACLSQQCANLTVYVKDPKYPNSVYCTKICVRKNYIRENDDASHIMDEG